MNRQYGTSRSRVLRFPPAKLSLINFTVDHVALALANLCHVGCDGTGRRAELRGVTHQLCDPRAPNLILAGQAGDVGTRSSHVFPLDHRDMLSL